MSELAVRDVQDHAVLARRGCGGARKAKQGVDQPLIRVAEHQLGRFFTNRLQSLGKLTRQFQKRFGTPRHGSKQAVRPHFRDHGRDYRHRAGAMHRSVGQRSARASCWVLLMLSICCSSSWLSLYSIAERLKGRHDA